MEGQEDSRETPTTFHPWGCLPSELKAHVLKNLELSERVEASVCSKSMRELVHSIPFNFVTASFCHNVMQTIVETKINWLRLPTSLFLKLLKNRSSSVSTIKIDSRINQEHLLILKEAIIGSSSLNIENIEFYLSEANKDLLMVLLASTKSSKIRGMLVNGINDNNFFEALVGTPHWTACKTIELKFINGTNPVQTDFVSFAHFEKIRLKMNMMTPDVACYFVQNFRERPLPCLSGFDISTIQRMDRNIFSNSESQGKLQFYKDGDNWCTMLKFNLKHDSKKVLLVTFGATGMTGMIAPAEVVNKDFSDPAFISPQAEDNGPSYTRSFFIFTHLII